MMRITGAESDEIAEVRVVENVVHERSNLEDYPKFHW